MADEITPDLSAILFSNTSTEKLTATSDAEDTMPTPEPIEPFADSETEVAETPVEETPVEVVNGPMPEPVLEVEQVTPTPTPIVEQSPVVEAVTPTVQTTPAVDDTDEYVKNNPLGPVIIQFLDRYERDMRPKRPIDQLKTGQIHTDFYNLILKICSDQTNFSKNWTYLLSRVNLNPNNVYNPEYVFRHIDRMRGSSQDSLLYSHLVTLIKNTCNPDTIQDGLKRIVLQKLLANVNSDVVRNNINNYYRRYL